MALLCAARHRGGAERHGTVLVGGPDDRRGLRCRPCRPWHRLAARLWAPSLDRRLAAGRPPERGVLTATRAGALVTPAARQRLAENWEHLMARVRVPETGRRGQVPLCRGRILEAGPAVRRMLVALTAPGPVPALGVAMAGRLLGDGTGPLYNRRCPADLGQSLDRITGRLDPSAVPGATSAPSV
ncbi:MAG: hypothetical protein ACRDY1_13060 [Acidimicrobiales bacterium]